MILFLCSPWHWDKVAEWARARGWTRTAAGRFVTQDRDDVRLVRRMSDFAPLSGAASCMAKGPGYDDGPEGDTPARREEWAQSRQDFDEFVASGRGRWTAMP